jgi:hypothetical protein
MSKKKEEIQHRKWEHRYEDENTISIWRYDSKKSMINPYEVEIKYKNDKPTKVKKKGGTK